MSVRSLPGMEKDYLVAGGVGVRGFQQADEKDAEPHVGYDTSPAKRMGNDVYGAVDHSAQFRPSAPRARLSPRGRNIEGGNSFPSVTKPRKPSINQNFVCPITQELMKDPVMAADGFTYERVAISEWLKDHNTSPSTNLELDHKNLIPNHAIRSMIMETVQKERRAGGSSVGV